MSDHDHDHDHDDADAPGWDAIDTALAQVYGVREPDAHFGTVVPYDAGGDEPLTGISGFWRDAPAPHWHLVTYGCTELFSKESDDPEVSGFGFEFTLRVAQPEREEQPPSWALNFLQNLGRYVFETGNRFATGHTMDLNGPIALDTETLIRGVTIAADPELPPQDTPNGRMQFLQIVGITLDELDACRRWSSAGVQPLLAERVPLLITDLDRGSITDQRDVQEAVTEGVRRDGSSQAFVNTQTMSWRIEGDRLRVTLGALDIESVQLALTGRVAHNLGYGVVGPAGGPITLQPGSPAGWQTDSDGDPVIIIDDAALAAMQRDLAPQRGTYVWESLPNVVIAVEPTEITDQDGNVIETVG